MKAYRQQQKACISGDPRNRGVISGDPGQKQICRQPAKQRDSFFSEVSRILPGSG